MNNLAVEVTDIVNEYISRGVTAEEVCGVLCGVSFRVMSASIAPAKTDGGSPVSLEEN